MASTYEAEPWVARALLASSIARTILNYPLYKLLLVFSFLCILSSIISIAVKMLLYLNVFMFLHFVIATVIPILLNRNTLEAENPQ